MLPWNFAQLTFMTFYTIFTLRCDLTVKVFGLSNLALRMATSFFLSRLTVFFLEYIDR